MRSIILRADRHIPHAIRNRSDSVFAASTRAISGWITSAAESVAGFGAIIRIPFLSDGLHRFVVRLEDFPNGVLRVQDCVVPGTVRTEQGGDGARVELHTIEDVLDVF
jgi:hypothetical protein